MADEKKELILSVGFDLDRAEERKLKASLDKQTFELEKQQREAKQLSQTLDELNKKYAALNEQHEKKRFKKAELERTYQEQETKMKAGDRSAAEWMFGGEGTKTKEEIAALTAEMKPLESELDEVNAKIEETEKKLGDVNAKLNTTAANVEVAREKLKKAHTPKIPKEIKSSAKELDRFGKRIKGLVKQAFIFGVIAKGLRTMVGYMGELLKSTPEYAEQLSQIKGNLMVTASSLWTALEPAISWLLSALNQLTQMLAVGVSTMLGQTREEAIEAAKAFDDLTKSSKKSTASLDTLHKLGDSSITPSYEALESIDESQWDSMADTFEVILSFVVAIGAALLTWKIASLIGQLAGFGGIWGVVAAAAIAAIILIVKNWDKIKEGVSKFIDWFSENVLDGMFGKGLGNSLKNTWETVTGFFEDVVSFLKNAFTGDVDAMLKDLVNILIGFINFLIDTINSSIQRLLGGGAQLINKIGSLFGADWNLDVSAIMIPHIPKLATGTIIPPNNPYLAVVGDQRSGTNVEAPLETIVEAMRIALQEQGTGNRNMEVVMELDGRELGRTFVQVYDEEKQRVGVRLAKA